MPYYSFAEKRMSHTFNINFLITLYCYGQVYRVPVFFECVTYKKLFEEWTAMFDSLYILLLCGHCI